MPGRETLRFPLRKSRLYFVSPKHAEYLIRLTSIVDQDVQLCHTWSVELKDGDNTVRTFLLLLELVDKPITLLELGQIGGDGDTASRPELVEFLGSFIACFLVTRSDVDFAAVSDEAGRNLLDSRS